MLKSLIAVLLLCAGAPAFAVDYSLGVGVEALGQRDVNPDNEAMRGVGQLYGKIRYRPFALELEASMTGTDTSSGTLHVKSSTTMLGAWGRWEFLHPQDYTPFASVGGGTYLDQVETTFGPSDDRRSGSRLFAGLGAGIGTLFWEHLEVEFEGRILSVEETKDPVISGTLRAGYAF